MKKVLLGMFLISVLAFGVSVEGSAGTWNVYLKGGVDQMSTYTEVEQSDSNVLWADNGETNKLGYSGQFIETYSFTDKFEGGVGAAYQMHAEHDTQPEINGVNPSFKMPSYKSIPIFAVAKYNLFTVGKFTPYLQGNLGYSFNQIVSNGEIGDTGIPKENYSSTSVTDGVYYGIGLGIEYGNLLFDAIYSVNTADLEEEATNGQVFTESQDYSRVVFSIGYKFPGL